ncbi:MAG: hypothetical protein VYA69_14795 [Gemmatimonadota bacterium]|nr:hypothetical protein [Gemmatimonadota bacterium]
MPRIICAVLIVLLATGCATRKPASLNTPDHQIEEIIYRYQYAMTSPVQQASMEYRDDNLFCRLLPQELVIGLDIINLQEETITIDWNQVRVIDPEGNAHPVVQNMVILRDMHRTRIPTTIMPQGVLNETVAPSDYAYLGFTGWQQRPIFPKTEDALNLKGAKVGVYLPVKIQNRVTNYLFEIVVTNVTKGIMIR